MKIKKEQIAGGNYQYTKLPLDSFIRSMQKLDVHKIEFYAASPHLYVWDYTPSEVWEIKRKLDHAGIEVICFTSEQCIYPVSIAIDDYHVRERSLRYYERALEQAAILGSPYMQMISGSGYLHSDPAEDLKRSTDGIYRLTKKAREVGVTIVLEADRTCTVGNTKQQIEMIKEINDPYFSGMIDTNAVWHAKEDFEEDVKLLGKDLRHIHFIDINEGGGCLIPGSGFLPMGDYLEILAKYSYNGYLVPELWGNRYAADPEEAAKKSLDFFTGKVE